VKPVRANNNFKPLKFCFVTISSKLPPWLGSLAEDYSKKLSFWIQTETPLLSKKSAPRENQDRKKQLEAESLLNFFTPDDYVILCEEEGKEMGSQQFAKKLENILAGGKKRIVIAVGGAYGVSEEVKARADFQLCLSKLTTSHHMALAFALEQIYRAMTILKNVSYHNE
jgi:23S rRNA (pseudouridine1915-N3)-methyltransferase